MWLSFINVSSTNTNTPSIDCIVGRVSLIGRWADGGHKVAVRQVFNKRCDRRVFIHLETRPPTGPP